MIALASFAVTLALGCVGYAVFAAIIGLLRRCPRWTSSAMRAINAVAWLLTLTVALLLYFLLLRDFRLEYVASFTSLSLPPMYALSALWAGQEGSLLFWAWATALCGAMFLRSARRETLKDRYGLRRVPPLLRAFPVYSADLLWATIALAGVLSLFLAALVGHSSPFRLLAATATPEDGSGLNPLLRNPYMVLHPPVLFLGYAGFSVPFAIAVAALCAGRLTAGWLAIMRRWTLFAWHLLGIGMLLGARWAYVELGWGGYWGWDPVENSSLIPWLTGAALLHTLILQQRAGALRRWNLCLSIVTFLLCLFGAFITRSGALQSVHAYAESAASVFYFLIFLAAALAVLIPLCWARRRELRSPPVNAPFLSKETALLLTAQLLMGFAFAVLYGTMYPLLAGLIASQNVVIGASFFNRVSVPLGLTLFGLIGACQLLAWKKSAQPNLRKHALTSAGLSGAAVILLRLFGVTAWPALLSGGLAAFALITLAMRGKAILRPFALFHLGAAIVMVGIAVSATYKQEQRVELRPGESAEVGAFRVEYVEMAQQEEIERRRVSAKMLISRNGRAIATLWPEKHFYSETMVTTEIGLYSSLLRDIYVSLDGWDDARKASFTVIISPALLWIWIGGFGVMTLGVVFKLFKA